MTTKQKLMEAVQRLPDGISMKEAIRRIQFIEEIEESLREADAGMGTPHDEFMDELLAELDDK